MTVLPNDAASDDRSEAQGPPTDLPDERDGTDLDVTVTAETELEAQRNASTPDHRGRATERPDDGLAPIINNTGDDGGAASG